jgi:diaminopimelate decarboxylase
MTTKVEQLQFLSQNEVDKIATEFGTPCFVYDRKTIADRYQYFSKLPNEFGLKIRFSVKSNPNRAILQLYSKLGADFDVSSVWEARRVIRAGINADRILMTAQEASPGWEELCRQGMIFDAGSLTQLEDFGKKFPGAKASIRINPGFGSGLVKKLTSGGVHSSFGIWIDHVDEAIEIAEKHNLIINRLHFHIGSGHESVVLEKTVELALQLARRLPGVDTLDLGGGYRIKAFAADPEYDHYAMAQRIERRLKEFYVETDRRLALELEPGTYLVSLAGSLITKVIDVVDTGPEGNKFLKIDGGLTEVMRTSYYGSPHPLVTVARDVNAKRPVEKFIVAGHCCIAGDILTPTPGNSEDFTPQSLEAAQTGDYLVVERAGGYAASMCMKNFNSYPESPEILRLAEGQYVLIRSRQTIEQMTENEVEVDV